jgi:uncharacterized protein
MIVALGGVILAKWTLNELRHECQQPLKVAEVVDSSSIVKKRNKQVVFVSSARVNGFFSLDQLGILGSFRIETVVGLPSTRSLELVAVPLKFKINEYYIDAAQHDLTHFAQSDVVIQLEDGLLDLDEVVADNILTHLPLKVLTPEEKSGTKQLPAGKDWRLIEEGKRAEKNQEIDPRLAKLKDFFKGKPDR